MQPGDRLVVAFVEQQAVGARFHNWPLHVTIVPWFRADLSSDELQSELLQRLQRQPPFEAVVDGEAHFGRRSQKLVNLIKLPSLFESIEAEVRHYLHDQRAWIVDETTRHRHRYRPHVTAQATARQQAGGRFRCDRLYIVEQKGDDKEIIAEIEFT